MTIEEGKKGVEQSDSDQKDKDVKGAANPAEKTVPLSVLEATRRDLKEQLAQRDRELAEARKANKPKDEAKETRVFTRVELRKLVTNGDITEDQMDEILETQLRKSIKEEAQAEISTTVSSATRAAKIDAELDRYVDAHPDLVEEGSDLRDRVAKEFAYLVNELGDGNNKVTELKAIRAVCGPLTKAKGRRPDPDSHEDIGGGRDTVGKGDDGEGWAKGLNASEKKHYQKLIDNGMYKSATDKALLQETDIIRRRRAN